MFFYMFVDRFCHSVVYMQDTKPQKCVDEQMCFWKMFLLDSYLGKLLHLDYRNKLLSE